MSRLPTYQRPMRRAWFLERHAYVSFILRELTSVFIGAYLVLLLILLGRGFAGGPEAFAACLATLSGVGWRVFHVLVLAAAVFHAVTWFNLLPQVMPVQIGADRLRGGVVAMLLGYLPWAVVTAVILGAVWV